MKKLIIGLFVFLLLSCTRNKPAEDSNTVVWYGAYPMAVLQPGKYPLWFQLTDEGPVHIETIEDAAFSTALVPWPLAAHIRFLHETDNGVVMVVNRDGFLKLAPVSANAQDIAVYRFSGGEYWRQYTAGGFIYYEGNPTALLYLDERFLSSDAPLPKQRTWSINMNSNVPFPVNIPLFDIFPSEDGWDIDTLRLAGDGLIYYRVAKRTGSSALVRMFRTADFEQAGKEITVDVFFSSAPKETVFSNSSLPPLPEGFVYTGIGRVSGSLFASWEEQTDFSIGAAGFVVVKP
ncbi:hypothetical protein [Treponema sp. R80B11-R83G3]